MLNTGRNNPGSSQVIEDALAEETTEDAELLRPLLVQLRAAADRPVPAPSAALQLLFDGESPSVSGVTQLDAFRTRREAKGEARYGAKRRTAATSLAVVMFLGAGTGVAAAVDGGVRQQIVASVEKVGTVLVPPVPAAPTMPAAPAPAPVEAATEIPVAIAAAPASAAAPEPVAAVEAPAVEAQAEPAVENTPAAVGAPGKSGESRGAAVDPRPGTGKAEVKVPAAAEAPRGSAGRGSGNVGGAAAKGSGWVPPGQAKKADEGAGKSARGKASDLLKKFKGR